MWNKNNDRLSVSLNEEVLKVAQIKGSGSAAKASNIVTLDVKGVPEEEMPKKLQGALAKFNAKNSDIFCVIPSDMVTTKNIDIPSVDPEEIKSIVSLQAGRHTPFSREEIEIGYVNIGVYKGNFTKVLLVIANRNYIRKQLALFEKIGLKVKKVLFSSEGVSSLYTRGLKLTEGDDPIGVIDIGKTSTDFTIVYKGMAIASRNVPLGRDSLSGETSSKDQLVEELSKTVESYQNEDIEKLPVKYILTTDDEITQDLKAVLTAKLSWNVEISPYVDFIKAGSGTLKKMANEFSSTSFLDILASGATLDEAQVNLIPEEIQLQKSVEEQGREVFKAAILSFIILVLVACGLGMRIYFHNTYLSRLQNDYQANREEVEMLEGLAMRSKIIQQYLSGRKVSLDTIKELYETIPDEIHLSGCVLDDEGKITLQGISETDPTIYDFQLKLRESEFFKNVEIQSTTSKKDRGKNVQAFEISLKLLASFDEDETSEEQTEE